MFNPVAIIFNNSDKSLYLKSQPCLLRRRDRVPGCQGQTLDPRWTVLKQKSLYSPLVNFHDSCQSIIWTSVRSQITVVVPRVPTTFSWVPVSQQVPTSTYAKEHRRGGGVRGLAPPSRGIESVAPDHLVRLGYLGQGLTHQQLHTVWDLVQLQKHYLRLCFVKD